MVPAAHLLHHGSDGYYIDDDNLSSAAAVKVKAVARSNKYLALQPIPITCLLGYDVSMFTIAVCIVVFLKYNSRHIHELIIG